MKIQLQGQNPDTLFGVFDMGASPSRPWMVLDCLPCLTKTRGRNLENSYFISALHRMTRVKELGRFQGFASKDMDHIVKHMEATKMPLNAMGAALGDGMSVNVVMRILVQLLYASRITKHKIKDTWKTASQKGLRGSMPDAVFRDSGV